MAITKTNSLTIVSKNNNTNTAVVRYIVDLTTTGQTWWNYDVKCQYVIDGISGENTNYTRLPLNSTIRVLDVQKTIYNASGKTVNASFSYYTGTSAGTVTGNASVYIDLPLNANITDATNFNDEQNPTISYSNPAGNAVNSLQACISLSGKTDDIKYRDIPINGSSYTFNLTDEERNTLRNATATNSRTVSFCLKTVIGENTYYSNLNKTLTIINANPKFEDFTYKDTNTLVTNVVGSNQVLVRGVSNLQVTISSENKMAAQKGASAKNYIVTIDNKIFNEDYKETDLTIDLETINSAGTKRLNIRAFDSRNNSTEVYKDIMIYDYAKPIINAEVARLNNFEAQTTLKIAGTYSRLVINDTDQNTIEELQYRYRETGKEWGEWLGSTATTTNGKFSCDDIILNLDNTKSFEIEIQVIDKLQSSTITLNVDAGQAIFFISSNEKACYINGNLDVLGNLTKGKKKIATIDEIYPVGSIYMSIKNTNPSNLFGGSWERFANGKVLVGVDENDANFNTIQKTGGEKAHTLTVNEIPSHWGHVNTWGGNYLDRFMDSGKSNNLFTSTSGGTTRGWSTQAGNEIVPATTNLGGSQSHNNLQPYITCFIWLRTA